MLTSPPPLRYQHSPAHWETYHLTSAYWEWNSAAVYSQVDHNEYAVKGEEEEEGSFWLSPGRSSNKTATNIAVERWSWKRRGCWCLCWCWLESERERESKHHSFTHCWSPRCKPVFCAQPITKRAPLYIAFSVALWYVSFVCLRERVTWFWV